MKLSSHSLLTVLCLAALVLFVCASAPLAQAGVVFSGTYFDIQASSPVNVGVTPLRAITLTVIGKAGYNPKGFDSVVDGGTGITTVGNKLHQIYQDGTEKTPTLTLDGDYDPIPQDLDTHFLVSLSSILATTAPSENRPTADTTEHVYGGFGYKLTGVFSLTGVANPNWDLAYLVVPNGTTVNLNFVLAGVRTAAPPACSESVHATFTVPEPTSLALLVAGLLPLGTIGLSPRRRHVD